MKISVRKFPYPYKCALAVCNDAEYLTWEAFNEIHKYLNTNKDTKIAKGLNLEIGDSFFMYSVNGARSFSYFDGITFNPSKHAPAMIDLMKAGCLDVIHSYGDFSGNACFTRDMAKKALDELKRSGVSVLVWTNHGAVEDIQNIGGEKPYYQKGDDPSSNAYHNDLTVKYGIKYFCLDYLISNEFVCNKKGIFGIKNGLVSAQKCRDKNVIYAFKRYRGERKFAPDSSSLQFQLSEKNLNELINNEGYCVVYQHLGVKRLEDGKPVSNEMPYFDSSNIKALEMLSGLFHDGKIFIAATSRLLNYNTVSNNIEWKTRKEGDKARIIIEKVKDKICGGYIPDIRSLQGVTFYSDIPEKTEIYLNENRIENTTINNADWTGKKSISVKWEKLNINL